MCAWRPLPDHTCACADTDLQQATNPVVSANGWWVEITCGVGHRRRIPRARWEAEVARRSPAPLHAPEEHQH
jgi:hypothetical protein